MYNALMGDDSGQQTIDGPLPGGPTTPGVMGSPIGAGAYGGNGAPGQSTSGSGTGGGTPGSTPSGGGQNPIGRQYQMWRDTAVNGVNGQPNPVATPIAGGTNAPGFQALGSSGATAAPAGSSTTTAANPAATGVQNTSAAATGTSSQSGNGNTYNPNVTTDTGSDGGLLPSASGMASFQPASYQSFGAVPYLQAQQMQSGQVQTPTGPTATNVDPNSAQQYYQQYAGLLEQSLQPTFQQQQDTLNQDMAARGIYNSGAASYNMGNLVSQQDATLASQLTPMVSQAYGYQQSDLTNNASAANAATLAGYSGNLQGSLLQASNDQSANQYNAQAVNAANSANADTYLGITSGNENNYNNYLAALMGDETSLRNTLLGGYIGSYTETPAAENALSPTGSSYGTAYSDSLANSQTGSPLGNLNWSQLFQTTGGNSGTPAGTPGYNPGADNVYGGNGSGSTTLDPQYTP